MSGQQSFLRRYVELPSFVDRFAHEPDKAVDVIIPVLHTNELWRANLLSAYRQIPINRLLLGDAGCVDDTIAIAREFPRVHVFDHRAFTSLGFSLRRLIEAVETDWFVYLHSDVYLPDGWFEAMENGKDKYDWFECGQMTTLVLQYVAPTLEVVRAYSGSQMGRKAALQSILPKIEDDYLYRNEDIILANLIKAAGYRYGKIADTYIEHQQMFKESPALRRVKRVAFDLELGKDEEVRGAMTYVKGIIKYLQPSQAEDLIAGIHENVQRLIELGALTVGEFERWVAATNPAWSHCFPVDDPEEWRDPEYCEPLGQYQPSLVGQSLISVLRIADLSLRGLIGPGRVIRRRLVAASDPEIIETRATQFATSAVKYVDQVARGRRKFRQIRANVRSVLAGRCRSIARGCHSIATRWEHA
jgi:hypothetical protein